MKKMFLGLGASMFLLFVLSFHSLADNSNGNGSAQLNQSEPLGNVLQFQFQQSDPLNDSGYGPSPETPLQTRKGASDGAGPFLNVTGAVPFELEGTVVGCLPGSGLALKTAVEEPTYIFGIGPDWFWEVNEIDRPAVGDVIHIKGYIVDYSGVSRYIATEITYIDIPEDTEAVSSEPIELRDEAGYPLWKNGRAMQIGRTNQTTS